MHKDNEIKLTTYDRLLRAWENSMELTRDYMNYSHCIEGDDKVKKIFKEFAEDEGEHAAKLKSLLLEQKHNAK